MRHSHERLRKAGLLSARSWATRPVRTALRLIPLRLKERINRIAGRPVFDLSFYLQFEPSSLEHIGLKIKRLDYVPEPARRRRVALVTPHLGPGGAENVLLDIARSLDRAADEIFLIATHSRDDRWAHLWRERADRVYDLAAMAEPEALPSALYSLIVNWRMDTVVLQNTLVGYSVIPHCKRELPGLHAVDVIHAVGGRWDIAAATAPVARYLDKRIVISEAAKRRLIALGSDERAIRLIPNGVDLDRFRPSAAPGDGVFRVLFAARLDPVKRPLLLAGIAHALARLEPKREFRFIVAGDGAEERALRRRLRRAGVEHLFELRGYVADIAPLVADCDTLIVTSSNEGVPLTIAEAFAGGRPVVASRAGAIDEIVDENTGVLIARGEDETSAFARALATLLNDPELRLRMGANARRRAETLYDRRRSLQLYRETLAFTPVSPG